MNSAENNSHSARARRPRLALAAFLFFLIKGLFWLAAGSGLVMVAW